MRSHLLSVLFLLAITVLNFGQSAKATLYEGLDLEDAKDFKGAKEKYDEVISTSPTGKVGVMAYYYRGNLFRRKNDYRAARADYNKAVKLSQLRTDLPPKLIADLHFNRGLLRYEGFDWEGALADFSKASSSDPGYAASHAYQGLLNYKLKNKATACANFQIAISLNASIVLKPQFEEAYKKTKNKCK